MAFVCVLYINIYVCMQCMGILCVECVIVILDDKMNTEAEHSHSTHTTLTKYSKSRMYANPDKSTHTHTISPLLILFESKTLQISSTAYEINKCIFNKLFSCTIANGLRIYLRV